MSVPAAPSSRPGPGRDHRFHRLRISRVVRETPDASSFVLDVPAGLHAAYRYEAGQFCTFRATIDGCPHLRCYSMSSSPEVGDELQVTVKRVPGGLVSNWMIDVLEPGDEIEATCPAGVFRLGPSDGELVAFAGGSGITPVFSLVKTALAVTSRRIRLFYANRDPDAVIFAECLAELAARHPGRLEITHHLDTERGLVDGSEVRGFLDGHAGADYYLCGPAPFMELVEGVLVPRGVGAERVHIERFTPPQPEEPDGPGTATGDAAAGAVRVAIELGGRRDEVDHRPGTTILQTARQMGMSPPFSCESGSCATCMARLVDGGVSMYVNNALTDDEVEEGWILTCQSVPTTPKVHVVYEEA